MDDISEGRKHYEGLAGAMEQLCSQAKKLREAHRLLLQRNAELVKLATEQKEVMQNLCNVGAVKPRDF